MRATLCNARESASGQFRSFDVVARIVDNKCLRHRDYLSPMRRLQASRFYIAGGSAEPAFILDGAVSEWLFTSGFWNRINNSLGTTFDQFEEDEAEPAVLLQIAPELEFCLRSLQSQGDGPVSFVCGWSPAGDTHTIEVQRADLVSQLVALRDLLASAAANREVLRFSL